MAGYQNTLVTPRGSLERLVQLQHAITPPGYATCIATKLHHWLRLHGPHGYINEQFCSSSIHPLWIMAFQGLGVLAQFMSFNLSTSINICGCTQLQVTVGLRVVIDYNT